MTVRTETLGEVHVVTIDRPEVRNAVDAATAEALADAFRDFDADESLSVGVLTGADGAFCAGYDLKSVADASAPELSPPVAGGRGDSPMGPAHLVLSKPVVAAVEGHAVAGGLELALWCDLRVAARDAVFGVFCRRWGVPLVDGGTIRLPRLLGHSHAMDLILTGRGVSGDEARMMGLANRLTEPGQALTEAVRLAEQLAAFPQRCMRSDRLSALEQWGLTYDQAASNEFERGVSVIRSGETQAGAGRFASGHGRHGSFDD